MIHYESTPKRSIHYQISPGIPKPKLTGWNVDFKTKRKRLLNVLRKHHLKSITPDMGFYEVLRITEVIDKLNKRLKL
jgi:hypothetical protein